jgi:hypothetical protein
MSSTIERTLGERIRAGEFDSGHMYPADRRDTQAMQAYRKHERQMREKFRAALEQEHGILPSHPLAEGLWSQAWEDGHSSGWSEVAMHYDEYAERLYRPVAKWQAMVDALGLAEGRIKLLASVMKRLPPGFDHDTDHPTGTNHVLRQIKAALP